MNEDGEEFEFDAEYEGDGFMSDVAARLIENEIYKNNLPKVALILAGVLDFCMAEMEDDVTVNDFRSALLSQILHELMYHEAVQLPSEEEEEEIVGEFRQWLEGAVEDYKKEEGN